ncbi:DUF1830 domain-containing protein [Crocosphaera chwakensis]|uniref:DUF1830 domain-containing protein n=1 Tax=Crocosphaera chwakensis CCY0110 TaxID=391612 RepID=A3IHD6_9CHRO|nr:DUF1830 domain-containing protein [Crocosphaera chwakensis]EAZ93218.1 hypothetical protein CY0110_15522 [Crocosphaera chwakensis CCY0110]
MAQILDPIPTGQRNVLLCCYVNATNHIQVARITNIENWYFERVVFPGQRLVFEALPKAQLEIHTGMMASAILSDTIPCERLCISDGSDDEIEEEFVSITASTNKKQTIQPDDKNNYPFSNLKAALV